MKIGRIVMIVAGALLALIGFGSLAGGAAAVGGYATQRTDGCWPALKSCARSVPFFTWRVVTLFLGNLNAA